MNILTAAPFERTFEHREALFDAALGEFVAHGYENASINTILKKAGMSKGQFYYHFDNKEGLYFALIEILIARKRAFLAAAMRPEDLAQDIFSIFQTQIRHSMAFAQEFPAINRFSESFLREKGNPIYERALARFGFDEEGTFDQLIEQAHRRGEFREDLPLPFIQKTIGYLFTHVADLNQVDDFEETLNHLVAFMKGGLAVRDRA